MDWKHFQTVDHLKREPQVGSGLFGIRLRGWALLKFFYLQGGRSLLGISNGPIQFESARKIWPLVELLAKIRWVLACSCSQNFCKCSHARILVKISYNLHLETMFPVWETGRHWGNMRTPWMFLEKRFSFCWRLLKLTGLSSVPGSRVTLPETFRLKGGLSLTLLKGNLLARKQGLRQLQIVKPSEVILQQTRHDWL